MKKQSTILKRFAKTLKRERDLRDMSQEKLAVATKLSRNYIGSLERGEANPTLVTLEKIADALRMESWKFLQ